MSLTLKVYVSDGSVLLAMDMSQPDSTFAGFAIACQPRGGQSIYLANRLSFTYGVSTATTAETRVWTPSDKAPFQKFSWIDFPAVDNVDEYTYTVTTMHFLDDAGLKPGDSATVTVNFATQFRSTFSQFQAGFTRAYLSSQAYADEFHNAAIRPAGPKKMDFDTVPFEKQYAWLGYTARKMIFDFLKECLEDRDIYVDLFAYDLDEPDFIRGLIQLTKEGRLRAFLDDSKDHVKATAVEPNVRKALQQAAPNAVVIGHFSRFAHDKVLIQRKGGFQGDPIKVQTGSANYSIRGLYVQANNVLVIEDAVTAKVYGEVFDTAFQAAKQNGSSTKVTTAFENSPYSKKYFPGSDGKPRVLPKFEVSFAPHADPNVSLSLVDEAIKNAKSSVLFAVMEMNGGGDVLKSLSTLDARADIYSFGVTQTAGGVELFKPGSPQHGEFATFAYLAKQVPEPFRQEISGGAGQVIHNKLIVVDFNGDNPIVFTGSSNLAAGGENQNGDNLLAIYDKTIATAYAVEVIRLTDHFNFRMLQQQHPSNAPITLQGPRATTPWWTDYYKPGTNKYHERLLLSGGVAGSVRHQIHDTASAEESERHSRSKALHAVTKNGKTRAYTKTHRTSAHSEAH
ncbi:MAG TPA: phospholipase D-like domain-containing protein [Acidobacteriaceae bacterium]